MRGSSWHAFLWILIVFFLSFSFIHLCSSAPSSPRNNLLAFWNLCDQWTIFDPFVKTLQRTCCHSQRSPQAFWFPFSFRAPMTSLPRIFHPQDDVLEGVTLHRFASGGEAWKRVLIEEEMTFTFTVIQVLGTENIVFSLSNDDLWALLRGFVTYKH